MLESLPAEQEALSKRTEAFAEWKLLKHSVSVFTQEPQLLVVDAEWVDGRMLSGSVAAEEIQHFLETLDEAGRAFPTASYKFGRLKVGPDVGSIATTIAGARYLEGRDGTERGLRQRTVSQSPRWTWWYLLPLVPVAMMLAAWAIPLGYVGVGVVSGLLLAVLLVAIVAHYRWELSVVVYGAVVGVFVVGVFGSAFAIAALVQPEGAWEMHRLGEAYLDSTAMSVGGVVTPGQPMGVAKVIAHIELLLFLTFVGGAVAAAATGFSRARRRLDSLQDALEAKPVQREP